MCFNLTRKFRACQLKSASTVRPNARRVSHCARVVSSMHGCVIRFAEDIASSRYFRPPERPNSVNNFVAALQELRVACARGISDLRKSGRHELLATGHPQGEPHPAGEVGSLLRWAHIYKNSPRSDANGIPLNSQLWIRCALTRVKSKLPTVDRANEHRIIGRDRQFTYGVPPNNPFANGTH